MASLVLKLRIFNVSSQKTDQDLQYTEDYYGINHIRHWLTITAAVLE